LSKFRTYNSSVCAFAFLLIALSNNSVSAQNFTRVGETATHHIYELKNDSLATGPSIETWHYAEGRIWDIFEISTVTHPTPDGKKAEAFPAYRVQKMGEGIHQKRRIEQIKINLATRLSSGDLSVVKYLKIALPKKRGDKPLSQSKSFSSSGNSSTAIGTISDSPLAEGDWYKITFKQDGIYRLTADDLRDAGISLENLNPERLQIWGTPGDMLPQRNNRERPELTELPILVDAGNDGSFDDDDVIYFYGDGQNKVERRLNFSDDSYLFVHQVHYYSNYNAVFIRTDAAQSGRRIQQAQVDNSAAEASNPITRFHDYSWKEEELNKAVDDLKSGTQWLGQLFTNESISRTQTIFQDTLPGIISSSPVTISANIAARSESSSTFEVLQNGQTLLQTYIPAITDLNSETGRAAYTRNERVDRTVNGLTDIIELKGELSSSSNSARAWIDYIAVTAERELIAENERMLFFMPEVVQRGRRHTFVMQGFDESPEVWNITDPVNPAIYPVTFQGGNARFSDVPDPLTRVAAQASYLRISTIEEIENTNIRGLSYFPNYFIITTEDFLPQAEELAEYRSQRQGLRPLVVKQENVFNEFSGGKPDIVAMRDMIRHFYNAAQNDDQLPKYLLMFGETNYDYKGIIENPERRNIVFTYQTEESLGRVSSYGTDDFFGLMDESEGSWASGTELIDIGIGRFPVQTTNEAQVMIDKIKHYENPDQTNGDWRTLFTFIADDDFPEVSTNKDLHVLNADSTAAIINREATGVRLKKIYEFDYPLENTSGGRRVPLATRDLIQTVNDGSLVMNYSGHGAERILSDERLFTADMVSQFYNYDRLTTFITATCSFGRFDDPEGQSGAEEIVQWADGGAVAAFTTVRVVYTSRSPTSSNFGLNRALTRIMTTPDPATGETRYLGDIHRETKIAGSFGSEQNGRKFVLLGDPAMQFGLPSKRGNVDTFNGNDASAQLYDARALEETRVTGAITNGNNAIDPSFNGTVSYKVYDAERFVSLPQDREWVQDENCNMPECGYYYQNAVLFSGRASVENGEFETGFVLPKDIAFSQKRARITFYAESETGENASWSYNNFRINGISGSIENDEQGPDLKVYLNDESYMDGSLVNESPRLLIELADPTGINASATGVGHEMTATLTNERGENTTYVLNEYYTAELDDYTAGRVDFQIPALAEGSYSIAVRAWDVYNNPSETTTDFTVANSGNLEIKRVYNFPNPMHRETNFVIEHNQPLQPLTISVRVFTLTGRPVYHHKLKDYITSSPFIQIPWNGRDLDGDPLSTGTYLYHVRVEADLPEGRQKTNTIEKLVIIR